MTVDPANAEELVVIAREVGAEVLAGHLRYPSETGGWQFGDLDLDEYLARYRDQTLMLIIAPVSGEEPLMNTCDICGFIHRKYGECPRCRIEIKEAAAELVDPGEERDVIDQVADWLNGNDGR